MNSVKTFTYKDNEVRMIEIDGEPWWILSDVCNVLSLTNPSKVALRLDEDERSKFDLGRSDETGGGGEANIINESGLYSVILRSDKPSAKSFRRWITHDILPSIRRHGLYIKDELLLQAIQELREVKSALNIQQQQIAEMSSKSGYYDVILNTKNTISVSAIAKDYGKSATWLNKKLHEFGVQFKQDGMWLLYQKYAEKGYTSTRTHGILGSNGELRSKMHTYFTQKGRLFIYELLKSNGILPLIEREIDDDEQLSLCEEL
ncbi:MAG: phage antirepressor KilAC domain-containing protein [Oscillospiraceae bacterium]|nr:phage antirepressor KilAC domain-containing protein [Oscillospiraceae bacterium]